MSEKENNVQRYLSLLGITQSSVSLDTLTKIVSAHLSKVPFENISKLYYWKTMGFNASIDLRQYLDGIEQNHFGGTCYANALHLNELLASLGFEAKLCGADMSRPNVHLVNVVTLSSMEYLVDVGYAAPFRRPIPLDLPDDYVIRHGAEVYVVRPKDNAGRSEVQLRRNGTYKHGYVVNPAPRALQEFEEVIAASFTPSATFMNAVLLARFGDESSCIIHNMNVMEMRGGRVSQKSLSSLDELCDAIHVFFRIPRAIIAMAVEGMTLSSDPWS